ncbi:porin [Methylocella sp.]|uniref:porin n=1 Tax=Methylocella sp. TaxID=1978226 RepID=UPI0035B29E89
MKAFKGLLLGSAAVMAGVSGVKAADLPARQAAPIEYVRVCDAYGAGFFYIPGTDTCLKVGGLVLGQVRFYDGSYSMSNAFVGSGTPSGLGLPGAALVAGGGQTPYGYVPTPGQYTNARTRDSYGWDTLGRVELDARTGTPWGTLRTFVRVDSYVGTGYANTGSLQSGGSFNNTGLYTATANSATRETTIVNRAFIQFAGLTAGRAQSMFDFYANAYNYQNLNGSSATTQLAAYTFRFADVWSTTLSVEDQSARAGAVGSTVSGFYTNATGAALQPNFVNGYSGTSFSGQPAGMRFPDVVANVRIDDKWGSAQISAAGHQARASLWSNTTGLGYGSSYGFPAASSDTYGWAVQGGVQLNADYLSPGDKLWLQAAYEKGAVSYIWGNNLASSYGAVSGNRFYGSGFTPSDSSTGWNANTPADCVFTLSGVCEQQSGWSIVAAYKHYWLPTLASAFFGSYAKINYSYNALQGYGGAVGVSNVGVARVGTNLVWTPVKGFDIGAEFLYLNNTISRPVGLASDAVLQSYGLPGFRGTQNMYEGRVRVQRAF